MKRSKQLYWYTVHLLNPSDFYDAYVSERHDFVHRSDSLTYRGILRMLRRDGIAGSETSIERVEIAVYC